MDAIGIEIHGLGGYGVVSTKIQNLLNNYPSEVIYDEISDSARATITIQEGQTYPVISGRTLTPGTYIFWYENERSLTKKLQLIHRYNLKGSGIWSLGQETSDTWNYYNNIVNGKLDNNIRISQEFSDVPVSHWAHDAIKVAKEKGWIFGRSERYFEPDGTLTRAEFATLMTRMMGYSYANTGDFYLDIKDHWARNHINAITQAQLMNGYHNGLFWPDNVVTREEVAKVLSLLINDAKENKNDNFSDVSKERWSYEYIQKLSNLGAFEGYADGTFQPQKPIKRSEMVTVLQRIFINN
ncbi:MAG: S-layer homology domain-containing protein [Clostridia bacterium]|nr:S-layer homology domain-containing protein [Clostridia bacterium]